MPAKYQSKTSVVMIVVENWTDDSRVEVSSQFNAGRAVAVQIASQCEMDLTGLDSLVQGEKVHLTAIYANNGRSLEEMYDILTPEMNTKPRAYWMIHWLEIWQGMLLCVVATRNTDEEWGPQRGKIVKLWK